MSHRMLAAINFGNEVSDGFTPEFVVSRFFHNHRFADAIVAIGAECYLTLVERVVKEDFPDILYSLLREDEIGLDTVKLCAERMDCSLAYFADRDIIPNVGIQMLCMIIKHSEAGEWFRDRFSHVRASVVTPEHPGCMMHGYREILMVNGDPETAHPALYLPAEFHGIQLEHRHYEPELLEMLPLLSQWEVHDEMGLEFAMYREWDRAKDVWEVLLLSLASLHQHERQTPSDDLLHTPESETEEPAEKEPS